MSERVTGKWLDAGAALLGLAILAAWLHPAGTRPLTWDEVDYVAAAREGVWANLVDRGAMGPITFVRFVLAKTGHGDPQAVASAAGYVEDENVLHLRHWHPPGGALPLVPAVAIVGAERGARLTQLGWAALLALLMIGVAREIAPRQAGLRAGAVLVVLIDPLTRYAALEAHFHVAVAAILLLPVWVWLAAARAPLDARRLGELREASRPGVPTAPMAGRAGALLLGLALGALWSVWALGEVWTVLWIAGLLIHPDARDWLVRERRIAWVGAGLVAALIVLWPGAFVKVAMVQTYATYSFYSLLLEAGKPGGVLLQLARFLREEPTFVLYALMGTAACVVGLVRGRRDALGVGLATVAFLILIAPVANIVRYLLPLLPLGALSGVALFGPGDEALSGAARPRSSRSAILTFALLGGSWALGSGFPYPDPLWTASLRDEYARVDRLAAAGADVLAEGGHIFRFYAPTGAARIRSVLVDYDGERLLLRDGMRYDTVAVERPAWIVLQRRGDGPEPPVMARLTALCRREDHNTHVNFACGGVGGGEPYAAVRVLRGAEADRARRDLGSPAR